jgi:hypothetical protein
MKIKSVLLLLSAWIFTTLSLASNQVVHYAPKVVTLTGIIKFKTFPGPPGYESVDRGDDEETCPYLLLNHPVDAVALPDDDKSTGSETEKNLKIVQIVANEKNSNWSWSNKTKYVGKPVRVTGTLFHSVTGHHHTRVLVEATHFKVVKK